MTKKLYIETFGRAMNERDSAHIIAELEEKLAKKKLLCANIVDESKHIKHVNLRGKAKDWLIFN